MPPQWTGATTPSGTGVGTTGDEVKAIEGVPAGEGEPAVGLVDGGAL